MSHVMSKSVFGVSDQVWLKPACSAREELEAWNFGFSKYRHYTIQAANNKGAYQTALMLRLIGAFVVRIWHKQVFSWRCCLFRFNVTFNNFSVISRQCLVVTGNSILTFIVLPHWSIMLQTHDMISYHIILTPGRPVLALSRKSECQARSSWYHFNDFGMSMTSHSFSWRGSYVKKSAWPKVWIHNPQKDMKTEVRMRTAQSTAKIGL